MNNIKRYRGMYEYSLRDLASKMGLSAEMIRILENSSNIKPEHLKKLCEIFNCDAIDIYGLDILKVELSESEKAHLITLLIYDIIKSYPNGDKVVSDVLSLNGFHKGY